MTVNITLSLTVTVTVTVFMTVAVTMNICTVPNTQTDIRQIKYLFRSNNILHNIAFLFQLLIFHKLIII